MFRDAQVNLYVRDVETSVRFYQQLGFVESFRTPKTGTPEHVELKLNGFTLGCASIDAAVRVHGLPAAAGPTRAEIVVWTDGDVDEIYDQLVAAGASSIKAPHNFLERLRVAWVTDPDGGPVQIVNEG